MMNLEGTKIKESYHIEFIDWVKLRKMKVDCKWCHQASVICLRSCVQQQSKGYPGRKMGVNPLFVGFFKSHVTR